MTRLARMQGRPLRYADTLIGVAPSERARERRRPRRTPEELPAARPDMEVKAPRAERQ